MSQGLTEPKGVRKSFRDILVRDADPPCAIDCLPGLATGSWCLTGVRGSGVTYQATNQLRPPWMNLAKRLAVGLNLEDLATWRRQPPLPKKNTRIPLRFT